MVRPLLILVFLFNLTISIAQNEIRTRREPIPTYPSVGKTIIEAIPQSFNSSPIATGYRVPAGSAEATAFNSLQDIPVNLYTGSPQVDIPIYSLTEGRLSLPLYISYNLSSIKPQSLASWTGLGMELKGIPTISRMVRGMPDEGFTLNGQGKKGYYFWGYNINPMDQNQDKEPDYFFIETPSGSGKFMFDRNKRIHFFPEADIRVQVSLQNNPNESASNHYAKKFTSFVVTFPDGIKYTFDQTNNESSAEVEVKSAQTNGYYPGGSNFSQFLKDNLLIQVWYCSKMESPYGEVINFSYDRVAYTYYKSAEQEGVGYCPTGSGMDKKINKVYVRSSQIKEITSSNLKVKFNSAARICNNDNSVSPAEQVCTIIGKGRSDLDSWSNFPLGLTLGKLLSDIDISDNESSPTKKLTYTFNYDYFNGSDYGLPTGYSYSDIGYTHQKRLKLKGLNTPQGVNYSFFYDSENEILPSRLTYGIDHWGWANGAENNLMSPYGFVGSEVFSPNVSNCGSNREPNFTAAKKGILTQIETNNGAKTILNYEANIIPDWFTGAPITVGGLRIKSIEQEDNLRNTKTEKRYSYTLPDNTTSGLRFLIPSYRVTYKPPSSSLVYFAHSNLFTSLLAESGRPEVAYSRVTEETAVFGATPNGGKIVTEFDLDPTTGTTREQPWLSCPDCEKPCPL